MASMLMPYGSHLLGALVSKVGDHGKRLEPYGSSRYAALVAKASVSKEASLAPYGLKVAGSLVTKAGGVGGGKAVHLGATDRPRKVVRLNAPRG